MRHPTVEWRGDNAREIERFLNRYVVRVDQSGDQLRVMGLGGLDLILKVGDKIMVDVELKQVGVMRRDAIAACPRVTWRGDNAAEVYRFVQDFGVEINVVGDDLWLLPQGQQFIVMNRGDEIVKNGNTLAVSVAGQDHRV